MLCWDSGKKLQNSNAAIFYKKINYKISLLVKNNTHFLILEYKSLHLSWYPKLFFSLAVISQQLGSDAIICWHNCFVERTTKLIYNLSPQHQKPLKIAYKVKSVHDHERLKMVPQYECKNSLNQNITHYGSPEIIIFIRQSPLVISSD